MFEIFKAYIAARAPLTEEEFALIKSVCAYKKLRKHQYLLQEGDTWKLHAFVAKGCLRTYSVDDKGIEHIIGFAIENWWTGDKESLMTASPSRFNIDAVEDSEVIIISDIHYEQLCKDIPAFYTMVNSILQKSFVAAQSRVHSAISNTAEEKYLDFVRKYPGFATRIPQSMIASFLGMTPETLSRVRKQSAKK